MADPRPSSDPFRSRAAALVLILLAASTLTLLSARYQRLGPLQRVEGEGFCPSAEACVIPALGGGFPLPFLVDDPQLSVPNSLHFGEDEFRLGPFMLDLLFFGAILLLLYAGLRGRRSPARP